MNGYNGDRIETWLRIAKKVQQRAKRTFEQFHVAGCCVEGEVNQIGLDIPRTPFGLWETDEDKIEEYKHSLRAILEAWVGYSMEELPDAAPYVQGMTLLAVVPLCVVKNTQNAFWIFVAIVTRGLSPGLYNAEPPLSGHRADTLLLQEICCERLPDLAARVGEQNFKDAVALLSPKWLLPVFGGVLPKESVLCLWDSLLMLEGSRAGDVGALSSTPIFVWAVAILQSIKRDLVKQLASFDTDIPQSVQLAQSITELAKNLPLGFKVDWERVPKWDPMKLRKRHAAVASSLAPKKPGSQRWLKHVWKPSKKRKDESPTASPPTSPRVQAKPVSPKPEKKEKPVEKPPKEEEVDLISHDAMTPTTGEDNNAFPLEVFWECEVESPQATDDTPKSSIGNDLLSFLTASPTTTSRDYGRRAQGMATNHPHAEILDCFNKPVSHALTATPAPLTSFSSPLQTTQPIPIPVQEKRKQESPEDLFQSLWDASRGS